MSLLSNTAWEAELAEQKARKEAEANDPQRLRRRAITMAMANPSNRHERHEVITFTRKVCRKRDLRHFLDTAEEADIRNVERILRL